MCVFFWSNFVLFLMSISLHFWYILLIYLCFYGFFWFVLNFSTPYFLWSLSLHTLNITNINWCLMFLKRVGNRQKELGAGWEKIHLNPHDFRALRWDSTISITRWAWNSFEKLMRPVMLYKERIIQLLHSNTAEFCVHKLVSDGQGQQTYNRILCSD